MSTNAYHCEKGMVGEGGEEQEEQQEEEEEEDEKVERLRNIPIDPLTRVWLPFWMRPSAATASW